MKTKRILIALCLAIFASFNLIASVPQNVKVEPDTIKHRINIRVAQNNQVMLRAACCEGQKWVNLVLKVYSNDGEMVYAQSMHKKGGIYKAFDMQKLPEGKYSFEKQRELKVLIIEDEPFAQQELKRLLALDPKQFFRLNRTYFVNIKSIMKVHKFFNSRLKIELKPAAENDILVSRVKVPEFLNWMES